MVIVVPYRNRQQHLAKFCQEMTGRKIVIVEQADNKPFNRAKLLNCGFLETDAEHYCFHDIDMIPMDVDYSPADVAHLAGKVSQFNYKDPYKQMGIKGKYFGGVNLFSKEAFRKVNGYSNEFWGWGSEDDEMLNNVVKFYEVEWRMGKFKSLHHNSADRSFHSQNILKNLAGRKEDDGLHACKYKLISKVESEKYVWIKVNL